MAATASALLPALLPSTPPLPELLHTAAAAMQIFHAGKTKYPAGDNWTCTRVIEDIVGAELHRDKAVDL